MSEKLKVLVLGTGFAGLGHATAFRAAGAEVVGIVGRTESVVKDVAKTLNIPYSGTDWPLALQECTPDIVSIATPGGAHDIPLLQAMDHGCHAFCDKPLAESAEKTNELYQKSLQKNVKTAFAASFRYMPEIIHAKRLIAAGMIGEPREAEFISHFNLDPAIPFGWSHTKQEGGGRLNNNFTHLISIATYVLGERLLSIGGRVRSDMPKAPIVSGVHNFTERRNFIPKDLNDPTLEWADCDVEWSYTVTADIESDYPAAQPVSVLFQHGGLVPRFNDDHIVFYGSAGAIYIKGHYGSGPLYLHNESGEWTEQKTPTDILTSLPDINDDTQRNWTHLAHIFVRDIKGETTEPYQSFKDGHHYQTLIDLIRNNKGQTNISHL